MAQEMMDVSPEITSSKSPQLPPTIDMDQNNQSSSAFNSNDTCSTTKDQNKQCEASKDTCSTIKDQTSVTCTAADESMIEQAMTDIQQNTWHEYFTNFLFWIRILVVILSIFLFGLSLSYCIAQLLEAKLDLITQCEPKTREEIWRHSYESTLKYSTNNTINEETQQGFTTDSCWTTKTFQVNSQQLWSTNTYNYEWIGIINTKCILFGITALYCFIVIAITIINLIIDIVSLYHGTLHKRSKFYKHKDLRKQEKMSAETSSCSQKCCQLWHNFIRWESQTYFKYFAQDTTCWIVFKFTSEISEILLQSNALVMYNGGDIFSSNIYQANQPQFIKLFAGIIAFNAFGSGSLWLLYATLPNRCYGYLFKRCIFFIDKFSDILYMVSPFIMLYYDDYNANTDDFLVLLAQLNIQSGLAFIAVYFPLFFACSKCLIISITSTYRTRKQYFEAWKLNQMPIISDGPRLNMDRIASNSVYKTSISNEQTAKESNTATKLWDRSWIRKSTDTRIDDKISFVCRRSVIIVVSVIFIVYGLFIVIYVINTMDNAIKMCKSVSETNFMHQTFSQHQLQLLEKHPELFLWDKCLYKVYPFISPGSTYTPCQCRVFIVDDWSGLRSSYKDRVKYLNITQQKIVNGALKHWYLLEKFRSHETEAPAFIAYSLESETFASTFMKAFEWSHARLNTMGNNISWPKLEYLHLDRTLLLNRLPSDLYGLADIKSLTLTDTGLNGFPSGICDMLNLQILEVTRAMSIDVLPKCLVKLKEMKVFAIDTSYLTYIPLGIFGLPELIEFSLFDSNISIHSLLEYNLPDDMDPDNISAVNIWFDDNFEYNKKAIFWLQSNDICDELLYNDTDKSIPYKLYDFMLHNNTKCDSGNDACNGDGESILCPPRLYADGTCNNWFVSVKNIGFCYIFMTSMH